MRTLTRLTKTPNALHCCSLSGHLKSGLQWHYQRSSIVSEPSARCPSALSADIASTSAGKNEARSDDKEAPRKNSELAELLSGGARLTRGAQMCWAQLVRPGDTVVDATCGNGGDTLWLARTVGPSGRVLAFDIQEEALESTQNMMEWELPASSHPQIQYVLDCHSRLKEYLDTEPQLICFNLGYLPFGDKELRTKPATTIKALESSLEIVAAEGLVSILSYVGHDGGKEEHDAVSSLLAGLEPNKWTVFQTRIANRPLAPVLSIIHKRKGG